MSKRKLLTLEESKPNTAPVKPYSNNPDSDKELRVLWNKYFNLPNGNLHPHIVTPGGDLIQDVNVIPPPHDGHHINKDLIKLDNTGLALSTSENNLFQSVLYSGSMLLKVLTTPPKDNLIN